MSPGYPEDRVRPQHAGRYEERSRRAEEVLQLR